LDDSSFIFRLSFVGRCVCLADRLIFIFVIFVFVGWEDGVWGEAGVGRVDEAGGEAEGQGLFVLGQVLAAP
jgi:hypothetical protein